MELQVEGRRLERRRDAHQRRRHAGEVQRHRVRDGGDEVRARHQERQAEEVRRHQRHVALDAPPLEKPLEHFLAAAFGPHHQVLGGAERRQRHRLRPQRVVGPHEDRPVLRGHAPLPHRLERQRRIVADRQIHLALLQLVGRAAPWAPTPSGCRSAAPARGARPSPAAGTPSRRRPTSASVQVRVLDAASKLSPRSRSSWSRPSSGRASRTMACARGVGVTPLGTRMNSGSSKATRIRFSAMLTAGWLMPSSRAARLTLSSSYSANAIGSRLRSGLFIARRPSISGRCGSARSGSPAARSDRRRPRCPRRVPWP